MLHSYIVSHLILFLTWLLSLLSPLFLPPSSLFSCFPVFFGNIGLRDDRRDHVVLVRISKRERGSSKGEPVLFNFFFIRFILVITAVVLSFFFLYRFLLSLLFVCSYQLSRLCFAFSSWNNIYSFEKSYLVSYCLLVYEGCGHISSLF